MEQLSAVLKRSGTDDDFRSVILVMDMLYSKAARDWPNRLFTPEVAVSDSEIEVTLTFSLVPPPVLDIPITPAELTRIVEARANGR